VSHFPIFRRLVIAAWCLVAMSSLVGVQADDGTELEFFEKKVRPILVARCYECHSSEGGHEKGGLALDSREGWHTGGDTGPAIVPGKPDDSLLIQAVDYSEAGYEMPPTGKLSDGERATLREWVARGAFDPRTAVAATGKPKGIDIDSGRQFWSFQPLARTPVPRVRDAGWPVRDSDRFLLASLEEHDLKPAAENEPARLLRRLTYDLTGLPPTAAETRSFVLAWNTADEDGRQAAVEAAADRLLASRQFGEKWARHWLDVARYADSNGSSFNPPFPQAWRYRNWVIRSFNDDLPVDQFLAKQIAGDLLPAASQEEQDDNLIATGFLMLGSKVLGEFDKEQLTMDVVDEQIDTIGKGMLGLTLGCARCHDHKFDPVPQRDYYALAGIFTSTVTLEDRFGGPKEDESDWSRRGLGPGGDEALRRFLADHRHEWIKSAQKADAAARKIADAQALLSKLPAEDPRREDAKKDLAKGAEDQAKYGPRITALRAELPPYAEAVRDNEAVADARLRIRGVASSRGDAIPRGFLQVAAYPDQPVVNPRQSGRLELARWIAAADNPLTARVFVNRVWQKLFGEGLVRSVDNFGVRGERPTHTALLDHLALQFIADGWRLKPLVRSIVTSRGYRMTSRLVPPSGAAGDEAMLRAQSSDPENRLLWRQNKRRLEPEEIRDTLLLAGGRLSFDPADSLIDHLPPADLNGDTAAIDIHDDRRTVYQPVIRTMEMDILQIFDFANPGMTTGQRYATTVAPQSLFFLNAPFVQDAANRMADRVMARLTPDALARPDGAAVAEQAFEEAVCRPPNDRERHLLAEYLRSQFEGPPGPSRHDVAKLCQALLGSTQFQFLE